MRHRSRSVARLLTVVILLATSYPWVVTGRAQTQGGITGTVTDSSGAAIPGATVTVTNTATRGTRNTTTNAEGLYTFPAVPPGSYELKVELQGFKTAEIPSFKVDVQQTVRVDVPLQVGALGETVTVVGKSTLLNTQSTTLGTVIENKIVTELPLNGRQYLNLVAVAPNVNVLSPAAGQAGARLGGERAAQSISAGGQRIFFNYYTLDGVSNTDPNFNNYIALPSIDAIQEFKVQTGVYPAEFGHQSTQVNVVTKSGGNAFHGSVFEFLRDEKFDAKPYAFTSVHPAKSPFKWNDFGYEVDGPVLRDKLFFMANFEKLRRRQTTQSTFTVPTEKMFAGDFSEILPGTVIYDPTTGQPFPGNVIPAGRIDPISKNLLSYYHAATLPGLQQQLRAGQLGAVRSQRLCRSRRLQRIVVVAVDGALQLGRRHAVEPGPRSGGFEDASRTTSSGAARTPGRSAPGWSTTRGSATPSSSTRSAPSRPLPTMWSPM